MVDPKKNNRKKWRAKEEERHKGPLTPQKSESFDDTFLNQTSINAMTVHICYVFKSISTYCNNNITFYHLYQWKVTYKTLV
jgi:hypothetical protein